MVTQLTSGNKKQLTCSGCQSVFTWNTADQKTIMGNKVISCPECGKEYIVPRSELQAKFENIVKMSYTQNIYNQEQASSSEDEITRIYLYLDGDGSWTCDYTHEELVQMMLAANEDATKFYLAAIDESTNNIIPLRVIGYDDQTTQIDIAGVYFDYQNKTYKILHGTSTSGSATVEYLTYTEPETKAELSFSKSPDGWTCNYTYQQIADLNGLYKVDNFVDIDGVSGTTNLVGYSFVGGDDGGFFFYCIASFNYNSTSAGTAYKIKIQSDDTITITQKPLSSGIESEVDGVRQNILQ